MLNRSTNDLFCMYNVTARPGYALDDLQGRVLLIAMLRMCTVYEGLFVLVQWLLPEVHHVNKLLRLEQLAESVFTEVQLFAYSLCQQR